MSVEELEEALAIPFPESGQLILEDSRRLTGPGLLWEFPGAIADVLVTGFPLNDVEACWQQHIQAVLAAVGWSEQKSISRQYDGGLNLAISAPIDQLYSAIFVVQAAWYYTACELLGTEPQPLQDLSEQIIAVMANEARPELLALQSAASSHSVDFLSDDETISIGHGVGSRSWPVDQLPDPDSVEWESLYDLPVAMITGTNGKSTCVRLASAVARAAGKVAGVTSTDFVRVGDEILDHGDYSGPGGARMLLRDPRLEFALLEVARGGILRRGLALQRAQAGLVTNVAADHLGQYGINTVAELTEAKFAVFRTLARGAVLVLNADDVGLVTYAYSQSEEVEQRGVRVCWFSLTPDNPEVVNARANDGSCGWLEDGQLIFFDGRTATVVSEVAKIPITMNGAARYNIQNALGVMCLCIELGLSRAAVRDGMADFHSDPTDNPGRCNEFRANGAQIFIDFAHNPHSIAAVSETMKNLPAKRRLLMLGHAGDRSDEDIRGLTAGAFGLEPDHVVICEVPDYLRGREEGEISQLIQRECIDQGLSEDQLSFSADPLAGAHRALQWLEEGDLALLLVFSHRDQVVELLQGAESS
ncbi:MAG: cyanophycin synthetase [Halieaceae bacterium]|jgi:cyanophycin synthetase